LYIKKIMTLNYSDYNKLLCSFSKRLGTLGITSYGDYVQYEEDWIDYYENIYLEYSDKTKPPRIFIAESAPQGAYSSNLNYIFHKTSLSTNINCSTDKYLWNYYKGVFPLTTSPMLCEMTKRNVLVELSKENILILDILPTHGIKLQTSDRNIIKKNFLGTTPTSGFTLPKIGFLRSIIGKGVINLAFSTPPSLYAKDFLITHGLNWNFVDFGNVNTGQGHVPSRKEIEKIIVAGF
jgi:hypothetical protein